MIAYYTQYTRRKLKISQMTTSVAALQPSEFSSIIDLIRHCISEFYRHDVFFGHGTDNEWDEAHHLVMQALDLPLDMPAKQIEACYPAKVSAAEQHKVFQYLSERTSNFRPLPYITNQAWFAGMPFYVDERVLIPRSPFAELIEGSFQPYLLKQPESILDLCTGGACIAIALSVQYPEAQVDAVDIDLDALDVASRNINDYQLEDRVFPIQSDLFAALKGQTYDLIVSNPPYVDAQDMQDLPDEFQHEPELALAAGEDGLDLVETILREAPDYMTEDAWLFCEVGNSEVHMASRFPGLVLTWCQFHKGGNGVFAVNRQQLVSYWQTRAQ